MHTVAVLALDGVIAFDLATPIEVFGRTRLPDGRAAYRVKVCALGGDVDAGAFTLRAPWDLSILDAADTIILPGLADPTAPLAPEILEALRRAADSGTRIASICVGAFTLAATGLLDGKRATTHWAAAELLAARHPLVDVDPAVLYVDNGQFLTSAGAAAGLDLCLHMIRSDHGSAVAADAARLSVMPLEREGGQAQFIVHERPPSAGMTSLDPLLRWMDENSRRRSDARRPRPASRDEHPHPQSEIPRADRHHTVAVASPRPDSSGAVPPGDHHALRRPHRRAGGLRVADGVPRPVQARSRHQPPFVPRGVPGILGDRVTASGAQPRNTSSPVVVTVGQELL